MNASIQLKPRQQVLGPPLHPKVRQPHYITKMASTIAKTGGFSVFFGGGGGDDMPVLKQKPSKGLHLGGGGRGICPPPLLDVCLPLEIYSVALAYRVCLPPVCWNSHLPPPPPPLKKILNAALESRQV